MKKKILVSLAVGVIIFAMVGVAGASTVSLEFDVNGVLPSSTPSVKLYNNTGFSEWNLYSVVGGLLNQRTYNVTGNASYLSPDTALSTGTLDAAMNLTMEARLKIIRINGEGGAFFQAFNGAYVYNAFFVSSGVNVLSSVGFTTIQVDTSQFHTYRIESSGNNNAFKFLIDGNQVFNGLASANTNLNGFGWGDGISAPSNGADVDWDFVRVSQNAPVPLPGAVWLLGSGLAGLIGARRKNK